MQFTSDQSFGRLAKVLLDRICATEDLTRPELAKVLGVSPRVVSSSVYSGQIPYALMVAIAKRASATPTEFVEFEILWMHAKSGKPREEPLRRCLEVAQVLHDEVDAMEAFAQKNGVLDELRRRRRRMGSALEKRARSILGE